MFNDDFNNFNNTNNFDELNSFFNDGNNYGSNYGNSGVRVEEGTNKKKGKKLFKVLLFAKLGFAGFWLYLFISRFF